MRGRRGKFKEENLEDQDDRFRRAQVAQKYRGILLIDVIGCSGKVLKRLSHENLWGDPRLEHHAQRGK